MNKTKENVVIIFAKKPMLDKVKTRIANETSPNFALELSLACFSDLVNKIKGSSFYDLIVGVDSLEEISWFQQNYGLDGFLIKPNKRIKTQSDKFHYIFSSLLNQKDLRYQNVILIPMDLPFITEEDLVAVLSRLNHYRFTHGPETNGGIYLIGISTPYSQNIFKNVRWSTPYSFNDLFSASQGISDLVYKLKYKTDLNTFHNILEAKREITYNCPNLYLLLKKNGYYLDDSGRYVDYDSISLCIPVVSALIEKGGKNDTRLLIQTRYKPSIDPKHSGLIEIPSGLIEKFEPIEEAIIREVKEETGIICKILDFKSNNSTIKLRGKEEIATVFKPFWCGQQLKGHRAYINIVFLCNHTSGKLKERYMETKNPRWISLKKLKEIILGKPNKVFSLHLPILKEYLKYKKLL